MAIPVRRSIALHPAHRVQQVQEAARWHPDALCLDLADLLPPAQRASAREGMRDALAAIGREGVEALARVSTEERAADLRAAVWPGLSALVVPGLRGPRDVWRLDSALAGLEQERGLALGSVGLVAYLDHGQGLWCAREMPSASPRVQALVLGMGDLAFDMLREPEAVPFFTGPMPRFPVPEYIWGRLALVAADAGVALLGLLGTTVAPGHAQGEKLLAAARLARQAGFKGAFTLHREGVEACNEAFPAPWPAREHGRQTSKVRRAAPAARRRATS